MICYYRVEKRKNKDQPVFQTPLSQWEWLQESWKVSFYRSFRNFGKFHLFFFLQKLFNVLVLVLVVVVVAVLPYL